MARNITAGNLAWPEFSIFNGHSPPFTWHHPTSKQVPRHSWNGPNGKFFYDSKTIFYNGIFTFFFRLQALLLHPACQITTTPPHLVETVPRHSGNGVQTTIAQSVVRASGKFLMFLLPFSTTNHRDICFIFQATTTTAQLTSIPLPSERSIVSLKATGTLVWIWCHVWQLSMPHSSGSELILLYHSFAIFKGIPSLCFFLGINF